MSDLPDLNTMSWLDLVKWCNEVTHDLDLTDRQYEDAWNDIYAEARRRDAAPAQAVNRDLQEAAEAVLESDAKINADLYYKSMKMVRAAVERARAAAPDVDPTPVMLDDEPFASRGQSPITQDALRRAGWERIIYNGVIPHWWKTLTSDNAGRLEGPYLEVRFNERNDQPPDAFTCYIVTHNNIKKAMGVRTLPQLRQLYALLCGREWGVQDAD